MNNTLLLVISLIAALGGNVAKKYYTDKDASKISGIFIFNAVSCLIAAAVLLLWGGLGTASAFTVILGVVFGAVTALQGITNLVALQIGPMSYTSVIISFSTLISALSGAAFFGETLTWTQIVGITLMLVSFCLATENNADEKRANLKWLILCLIAFISTGGIGIMQKVHQSSEYSGEINAFLIIAFASSAVFCTVFTLALKNRENRPVCEKRGRSYDKKQLCIIIGSMLISGACVAVNNKLNLYLSGVMDSAVFFPIVNGGGLVLTTIAAVVIFKEKLTKKQLIGIIIGIASVVFLCDPF